MSSEQASTRTTTAARAEPVVADDHTATPLADMVDLTGQVAAVTGGANGIGRASARRLEEAGATVYRLDLAYAQDDPPSPSAHRASKTIELDVTDPDQVASAIAQIRQRHDRLDIWVHAAGIMPRRPLLDMPLEEWRDVINVNLNGTFLCAQHAGRAMANSGGGIIVTLGSTVAYRVNNNAAHYRATKTAVLALTQNLAIELAPRGVRALAICPTLTMTDGVRQLQADNPKAGIDCYGARLPLGRAAVPDDIARVVLFAVSPLASFMTGSALIVDGGELQR